MATLAATNGADSRQKTVIITCNKGGVGKSTTVAQIADNCARFGLRVLVIDVDSNASLSALLGTVAAPDEPSILEALEGSAPIGAAITEPEGWQPDEDREWMCGGPLLPGGVVHAVLGSNSDEVAEATNKAGSGPENSLRRALSEFEGAEEYDLILIDVPRTDGPPLYLALNASGNALFPMETEGLSFDPVFKTIEKVARYSRDTGNSMNAVGVVAAKHNPHRVEHRECLADVRTKLAESFNGAITMLDPPVQVRAVVADSATLQQPVSRQVTPGGKNSEVSACYTGIALATAAAIIPEDRLEKIFGAIDNADLPEHVADTIYAGLTSPAEK